MLRIAVSLAGVLLLTPLAAASADTPPDWLVRPTPSQLQAVWPAAAYQRGVGGSATLQCKVSVQGALRDCVVMSEDPPGLGFGVAALALTPQLLMKPATRDGAPVEGAVVIPVSFGAPPHPERPSETFPGRIPDAAPAGDRVVTGVNWLSAPSYAQVVAAYPARAAAGRVGGHVAMSCRFAGDGRLADCAVISEQPSGYGLGAAARTLARDFLGPRVDGAGAPIKDATTEIAVTFAPEMLSGEQPVIGKPSWTHLPDSLDVAQGFPPAAVAAHVATGHVTLACEIAAQGRLSDCLVTRQDPDGLGFDKAALALAPRFQVSVWTDEGLPTVGGRVSVPFRYEAPSGP